MKLFITTIFVAFLLAPALGFADQASAKIDGNCALQKAALSVPAGKTAGGFAVAGLSAGTKCKVGGAPDSKGWGITLNGNKVYAWSQFKDQAPTEVGGPLANVSLAPGAYEVYVDGGSGAVVTLNYSLR